MGAKETLNAVEKLNGKGDATCIIGPTQNGKSTSLGAFSPNEVVQDILAIRESDGKGGTVLADIQVTDHPDIPEEVVVVSAKISNIGMTNVNDDGVFLTDVLYPALSDYKRNPDEASFKKSIEKNYRLKIDKPANNSLGYKIKNTDVEAQEELLRVMQSVDIQSAYSVFEEANANEYKGAEVTRRFYRILKDNAALKGFIDEFWSTVIRIINIDAGKLKAELIAAGAIFRDEDAFSIIVGEEALGTAWLNHLLKSEDNSKEYFLENLSLVFRGCEEIFNEETKDAFKVSEENGVDIHCLHLVDTQGLFHANGATVTEEADRIIDMISASHATSVILVITANVNNTTKDGYEAIRLFLSKATKKIRVYILFTHWDDFLRQEDKKGIAEAKKKPRFAFGEAVEVDWNKLYDSAKAKEDEKVKSLEEAVALNTAKNKPSIIKVFDAANLTDASSPSEQLLFGKRVYYPLAIEDIVAEMACQEKIIGSKYRVSTNKDICTISLKGMTQSIRALYRDMVVNCKTNRLYPSTVRACVNKWRFSGAEHKSDVAENAYGFRNITTAFVPEIRNLGIAVMNKVTINTECVLGEDRKLEFEESLRSYLKECLGREIAKVIGQDSYVNGFMSGPYGLYQYEYFTNMITYTQNNYFCGEQLSFGPSTKKLECKIAEALSNCTKNFIDARCIEVY